MSSGCCPSLGEILHIFVVSVDVDRMSCTLYVDPPLFESCYHCQQLLVVDRIVEFSWSELLRIVTYGMQVACWGWLRQDATERKVRGVRFNCEGKVGLVYRLYTRSVAESEQM